MRFYRVAVLITFFVATRALEAHDFWLITDFFAKAGQKIKVAAHTGDKFPTGDSAVALDRIARFELHSARGKTDITGAQVSERATFAESPLKEPGTYVATIEIRPRFLKLEAKQFNEYLTHEGLTRILEMRVNAKKDTDPGRELYAKFAKAIIHAEDAARSGAGKPRGAAAKGGKAEPSLGEDFATRPLGLKLEIVPQIDPAQVRPGEKLPVLVLFEGKPLGNAQVACVSDSHVDEADYSFTTRTNVQGIAMIPILNPGSWLVRLVHMIPASEGKDHDWESFFSTLTFRIAPEKGFPLTVESIMRGPDLVGYGISAVRWTGDSSKLYFSWRKPREKEAHTYVLPRAGGIPKRLTEEEAKSAPPAFGGNYTKDRKRVIFAEDGDLILQDTVGGQRTVLVRTVDAESSPRFTRDEKHVTFVRENNLYRLALDTVELVQLTDIRQGPQRPEPKLTDSQKFLKDQQQELFEIVRDRVDEKEKAEAKRKAKEKRKPYYLPQGSSVSGLQLSPDESVVLFIQSERAEQAKTAGVPNYVTESGYTEDISSRTKVGDVQGKPRMAIVSVETGDVVWIDHGQKDRDVSVANPHWSEDGKNLLVTCISGDNKDRWYLLVDVKTGATRVLENLHDDAWVTGSLFGGGSVGWMPDNANIYFISEKDGYFHLYKAAIDGSGTKALTSGKFEVFSPFLSEDKSRFYFTSSEAHPGERHFYSMPVAGGARTQITGMTGSNQATLSPDEKAIALIYSYSNKPPELYLMENAPAAKAAQITVTPTEEWRSFPWVDPKLITFRARDGAEVYARVYTPEMLAASREKNTSGALPQPGRGGSQTGASRRPGVIFVHGAGYAQNVHKYWSSYFHEYMFHHILMDRGFVVMDIDYRASSGYGRDWRTAIYRHMGGKDLDDQVDGARWMVENLNVDAKRIGIYGGSYGGFITLMAMFTAPDTFAAGAALRPVTDWAHYNNGYTSSILNNPQKDEEAYKRSSPIYFAEGLKGALLICHGMVDVNVHFQDTVRLAERLMELRKNNWEVAVYPVEDHGFRRSDSWVDEYKRILRLFETHLKR